MQQTSQSEAKRRISCTWILTLLLLLTGASPSKQKNYLGALEKKVVEEQNLARTDPRTYAKYLRRHRASFRGTVYRSRSGQRITSKEGVKAVDEAIQFLEEAEPVKALGPSRALSSAAQDHVKATGRKGIIGHTGSDGSQPAERVSRHGAWQGITACARPRILSCS